MIFTYYFVPDIEMFFLTFQKELMCHELLGCVCVCLGFKLKQRNWCSSLLVLWLTFPFPIYILVNPNAEWNKRLYEFGGSSVCFFVGASFNVIYIYIVCNSQWCGPLTYTFDILQNWENSWFESPRMGIYFFVSWRWVQIWWSQFRSIFTGRVFDWFHLEQ